MASTVFWNLMGQENWIGKGLVIGTTLIASISTSAIITVVAHKIISTLLPSSTVQEKKTCDTFSLVPGSLAGVLATSYIVNYLLFFIIKDYERPMLSFLGQISGVVCSGSLAKALTFN